jgi:hypothetical protein
MTKLLPLSKIPRAAREIEANARRCYRTRAAALKVTDYLIDVVPVCRPRPGSSTPAIGRVITPQAAKAVCNTLSRKNAPWRLRIAFVGRPSEVG